DVLRVVIAEDVLPAFGNLRSGDVETKATANDPEDVVSRVDRLVEARLGAALQGLLPGSLLVGEEAVHADERLLAAIESDAPVWVIDPIDGTRNFVRGEPEFGVMLALVVSGSTRAAWIALPARDQLFVAEAGGGTWLNGQRLRVLATRDRARRRASIYTKYMPEPLKSSVINLSFTQFERAPASGSAALEYTDLLLGRKDFVIYHRLLPWDHLPGALLLAEAGGSARLLSGAQYGPVHRTGPLILAAQPRLGERVRRWVSAVLPSDAPTRAESPSGSRNGRSARLQRED
ncbi:MAG TPA: inositol monophosphatase, partial [Polyangiaceae bacterium]